MTETRKCRTFEKIFASRKKSIEILAFRDKFAIYRILFEEIRRKEKEIFSVIYYTVGKMNPRSSRIDSKNMSRGI